MGILSWIVLGIIAGALAKWLMPGKDGGGIFITMALGIAGAFVGGYLGSFIGVLRVVASIWPASGQRQPVPSCYYGSTGR